MGEMGWRAECGHIVFISKDYYSGEWAQCADCGQWGEIPGGFYNRIPIQYTRIVVVVAPLAITAGYIISARDFGNPPWWAVLVLLPWLFLTTMVIPPALVLTVVSMLIKGPSSDSGMLSAVGRRGLRAFIGVTDIGMYLPIITYCLLAVAYVWTYSAGIGRSTWMRNPWFFMVFGAVLALGLTAIAAVLAYKLAPPRLKKFFGVLPTPGH